MISGSFWGARVMRGVAFLAGGVVLVFEGFLIYRGRAHFAYMPLGRVLPALIILALSLFVTTVFIVRVALTPADGSGVAGLASTAGWQRWVQPSYQAVRAICGSRGCQLAAVLAGMVYAAIFLVSQGSFSRDPIGPQAVVLWDGVPGYAPQFSVFPVKGAGVVISAYQLAAMSCLSILFGTNAAMLVRLGTMTGLKGLGLFGRGRLGRGGSVGLGLGGAIGGLLLSCPSCAATPLISLISTGLLPLGAFLQHTIGSLLVYLASLAMVWVALCLSSRAVESGGACRI